MPCGKVLKHSVSDSSLEARESDIRDATKLNNERNYWYKELVKKLIKKDQEMEFLTETSKQLSYRNQVLEADLNSKFKEADALNTKLKYLAACYQALVQKLMLKESGLEAINHKNQTLEVKLQAKTLEAKTLKIKLNHLANCYQAVVRKLMKREEDLELIAKHNEAIMEANLKFRTVDTPFLKDSLGNSSDREKRWRTQVRNNDCLLEVQTTKKVKKLKKVKMSPCNWKELKQEDSIFQNFYLLHENTKLRKAVTQNLESMLPGPSSPSIGYDSIAKLIIEAKQKKIA